jgi:type II secretory pathway pseudopilin PulG
LKRFIVIRVVVVIVVIGVVLVIIIHGVGIAVAKVYNKESGDTGENLSAIHHFDAT